MGVKCSRKRQVFRLRWKMRDEPAVVAERGGSFHSQKPGKGTQMEGDIVQPAIRQKTWCFNDIK